MRACDLIELAAIASVQGPTLIESNLSIPPQSIEQYWTTSKVRLDRWAWRLKRFVGDADTDAHQRRRQWPEVQGVLEEILTSEMLTRVWTAVLCAYDRQRKTEEASPVARSVLIGHMEARHRVLTLMVRGPGIDAEDAVKLNRLRRHVERWTDLLVGRIAALHDVGEFAFDPRRAKDFAADLQYHGGLQGKQLVWPLMLTSLRAGFRKSLDACSPNADLNARIAASVLACFPNDLFDSIGLFRSLWLMRLTNITADAQGMIDDLLVAESSGKPNKSAATSTFPTQRLRHFGG
jgi:hypothetical protein